MIVLSKQAPSPADVRRSCWNLSPLHGGAPLAGKGIVAAVITPLPLAVWRHGGGVIPPRFLITGPFILAERRTSTLAHALSPATRQYDSRVMQIDPLEAAGPDPLPRDGR